MATGSTSVPVPIERGSTTKLKKFLSRNFYVCMSVRYVPGACESELVANRNAGAFRVMTRSPDVRSGCITGFAGKSPIHSSKVG